MAEPIHFQPGEKILLKLRKHWIILLRDTIGSVIVGLFPLIAETIALALGILPQTSFALGPILIYLSTLWLLIVWMALAVIWTDYYLDLWIVTDKRIISIDQITLFNRKVTSLSLDRIQEVIVTTNNVLETYFQFGTLQIETAGPTDLDSTMEGIPRPEEVRNVILQQTSGNNQ